MATSPTYPPPFDPSQPVTTVRPQLDAGVSPIRLQKYLARGLFAIVIIALACAFTWASAWMWP